MALPPVATAWSEVGYLGVAQVRKATDYDDSVAPADGQAILWVASGGKFAPRTVVLPTDARLSDTRVPKTHAASHAPGGSDPLTGYVAASTVGAASGVASLDSGGKVPQAQIPAIALTDYLGSVGSQATMLALTGQRGDWCYRSDTGTDWQLIAEPATSLASWQERHYPASPVSSVNGRTGAVSGLVESTDTRLTADQAAAAASIRTLGAGSTQAAAGNHSHAYLDQAAGDTRYRQHNQTVRTGSASSSITVDGSAAGDVDLTCTGDVVITPSGTPNGRTLVITALASGGARSLSIVSTVPMSEGVASRAVATPSGGKARFVLRYSSLGTAGWSLDSAFLVG